VSLPDKKVLKEKNILRALVEDIATIKTNLVEINSSLKKSQESLETIDSIKEFLEKRFDTKLH